MRELVTSHVASVPQRPEWHACCHCRGAGVRRATPILSAHELTCSGEG